MKYENAETIQNMEFPLEYMRILKIDQLRTGNLKLFIKVRFTLCVFKEDLLYRIDCPYSQMSFEIEQSYWINKVLPSISFHEYFLIEIPKGEKSIKEAWNYIEKADLLYASWDSKGAIVNCRDAGVLLNNYIIQQFTGENDLEKWNRSYKHFNYFVSLFLHVEERNIEINKYDVENVLIITKALLKYAEGLLRSKNV